MYVWCLIPSSTYAIQKYQYKDVISSKETNENGICFIPNQAQG